MSGPYSYARFVMPLVYAAGSDGAPLAGGKLYFFQGSPDDTGGTTDPLDTYTDATLSKKNTNPVVADISGTWPPIFLDPTLIYKVVLVREDGSTVWAQNPVAAFNPTTNAPLTSVVVECTVDGNGQVPQVGICGDAYLPVACTLVAAVLQANVPGDLVIDVWVNDFVTNTPPTALNSITASAPPTLSSSVSSIDTTLTGWTTAIDAASAFRFNINSINGITRFSLTLVGNTGS